MTTEAKVVLGIAAVTVILLSGLVWYGGRKQGDSLNYTTAFPSNYDVGDYINDSDYQEGSPNAQVTLINFSDYECPYCREFEPIIMSLHDDFTTDQLRVVWRHLPITEIHQQAYPAAVAAQAALKQGKFKEYNAALYNNVPQFGEELYKSIAQDLGLNLDQFNSDRQNEQVQWEAFRARIFFQNHALAIQTPTVFINGTEYTGARTKEAIEQRIKDELALPSQ